MNGRGFTWDDFQHDYRRRAGFCTLRISARGGEGLDYGDEGVWMYFNAYLAPDYPELMYEERGSDTGRVYFDWQTLQRRADVLIPGHTYGPRWESSRHDAVATIVRDLESFRVILERIVIPFWNRLDTVQALDRILNADNPDKALLHDEGPASICVAYMANNPRLTEIALEQIRSLPVNTGLSHAKRAFEKLRQAGLVQVLPHTPSGTS
jgi:hypothetical protein